MKADILEVLMYLFENHMQDNCELQVSEQVLLEELRDAGFESDEIRRALNWLDGLQRATEAAKKIPQLTKNAFRVLTADEYAKLGTECWGFIVFLELVGILTPVARELVLDRLMSWEVNHIDLADVKWVTLMVLFNQPDAKAALKVMENLVLEDTLGGIH